MATIKRYVEARSSAGLVTGLSPTVVAVTQLTDLADLTPVGDYVTVREIAHGVYELVCALTQGFLVTVDFGATLTSPDDRYKNVVVTPDDESVTVVSTPTGLFDIQVTTKQSDTTIIPEARVLIINESGMVIRDKMTNSNGTFEAATKLDAGTYTFVGVKARYSITSQTVEISGNGTVALVGEPISVSVSEPGVQTLWFVPRTPDGVYDTGAVITAELVNNNVTDGDTLYTGPVSTAVDEGDHYELKVAKTQIYRLSGILSTGRRYLGMKITVTDDDTATIDDYLNPVGGE